MLDNGPFPVTVAYDFFVRCQSHTIGANSEVDADRAPIHICRMVDEPSDAPVRVGVNCHCQ